MNDTPVYTGIPPVYAGMSFQVPVDRRYVRLSVMVSGDVPTASLRAEFSADPGFEKGRTTYRTSAPLLFKSRFNNLRDRLADWIRS